MSTFTITPNDVGRKVRLRNGEVSKILDCSIILHTPFYLEDEGWYFANGKYSNPGDLLTDSSKDVVAWADEQVTEQPRPKDLRDEFAMSAMQSLILTNPTSSSEFSGDIWENPNGRGVHEWMSSTAYAIADAMLKAREVK